MTEKKTLTPSQITEFQKSGFLVLEKFYHLDNNILPIQRGIYDIIGQIMARHGVNDQRKPFDPQFFDDGYLELISTDRSWGGEVYDAVKQIPSYLRLLSHPVHEALFIELRGKAIPGIAAGGYGIRIDNPREDKFRALWHQEYPAQLRSLDGLVFWSPLVAISENMGPVRLCPRSHREGALPVEIAGADSGRTGAYALQLHEEEKSLEKYAEIAPLTTPGDLIIIEFLTLHASGHNRGSRSRWSMQFRYFNFADPVGRSHGWKGSFAAGVDFRDIHSELCVTR